jgi:hypothetical protein
MIGAVCAVGHAPTNATHTTTHKTHKNQNAAAW